MARSSVAVRLRAAVRIHREIVSETYPSATRLGQLLGIAAKTARKYVGILDETFGLRPVYDPVRHGYHYPDGSNPKLVPRLTEDEVVAVFLLEQAAKTYRGTPVEPILQSALDKLALMLPVGCGLSFDQVSAALSLRPERGAGLPGPRPAALKTLYQGLIRHRQVEVRYQGRRSGKTTRRRLDPLHLTYCEGQWYLIAYCHLRKAVRVFVPARMAAAKLLPKNFTPPAKFNAEEFFRTAFGIVAGQKVGEVSLRFDRIAAPTIRERRWHATQKMEELPDGEVRLRMKCSQGHELTAWLLGWGEHVHVESPSRLARMVRAAHRRAAGRG